MATTPVPTRRGRRRLLALLMIVALVGGAAAWHLRRPTAPEPPAVDFAGLDPELSAAITEARERVRREPRSADAWGRLGMLLGAHWLTQPSQVCFAQAAELDPKDSRWPYLQALGLLNDDPVAAVPKLERAAALTDAESSRARLAEAELMLGRDADAERHFREVLDLHPGSARASLGLARLAFARGDRAAAEDHLRRVLDGRGGRKAALSLLAEVLRAGGDPAAAAKAEGEAAGLPDDPPWPDPDAEELARAQVGDEARLKQAERLAERQPAAALDLLRRLAQDHPGSARYGEYLAYQLILMRDFAGAEGVLQGVLRSDPSSPRTHLLLGIAESNQGRQAEAAASFRRAAELRPNYLDAYNNLAVSLQQSGDRPGAVAAYRQALGCQPQSARLHVALAELLLQDGQAAEAVTHLREAVQLDPADGRARRLLADAEKQPGGGRR
jgi:Flp pilus assembly protein TadD